MKRSRHQTPVIPLILLTTLGLVGCQSPTQPGAEEPLAVYCFHGNETCENCEKIEQWSHAALEEEFGEELADGRIHWEVINFDAEGNEHFKDDYEIITSCIVLDPTPSEPGADWTNLQQQVWQFATSDDRAGMRELITSEVREKLGK